MGDHLLAIDLGGTKMRAAVVDPEGAVHERRAEPTPRDARCPDALLALAGDVIAEGTVGAAVVGVPGHVDYRHGRLAYAPNLPPHWPEALDTDHLQEALGMQVAIANDADLAAVGEAYFGAGRKLEDVAYVTISTGVGAGVLLDRRLVRGRWSVVELGHTVIDHRAAAEGRPATFEELGSGTALGRAARAAGLDPDGRHLAAAVRAGEEGPTRIWSELTEAVAAGITNLAFLFHPEAIILGGGVGLNGDLLLEPLRRRLREAGPPQLPEPIKVVNALLGDDAGLIGAARWHEATRGGDR